MAKKRRSDSESADADEPSELTIRLEDSDDNLVASAPAPVNVSAPDDETPEFSFGLEESGDGLEELEDSEAAAEDEGGGLGALPPRYDLLLNRAKAQPFPECPRCSAATRAKTLSIFALVRAEQPLLFAHTGPLCPSCELFIVHADELDVPGEILDAVEFLGTIEAGFARLCEREPRPLEELLAQLSDFRSFSVIRERRAGSA